MTTTNADSWVTQHKQVVAQYGTDPVTIDGQPHKAPRFPEAAAKSFTKFWADKVAARGAASSFLPEEVTGTYRRIFFDWTRDTMPVTSFPSNYTTDAQGARWLTPEVSFYLWENTGRLAAALDGWGALPSTWDYFKEIPGAVVDVARGAEKKAAELLGGTGKVLLIGAVVVGVVVTAVVVAGRRRR